MSVTSLHPHFRVPVILLAALLVNALLFTAIEIMVGAKRVRLTETEDFAIANFIRMQEPSREVRSRRDPSAPLKPQSQVQRDLRRLSSAGTAGVGSLAFDVPDVDIDADVELDLGGDIAIARELFPIVRVPPEYPMRASENNVEGFVTLRFIVNETGSVEDPEVIRSEPPGVFDKAALRAVRRWKFQPVIRNGKPVRVYGVNTITFKVQKDS